VVAAVKEPPVAKEKRGGARPGAGRPKTSDRDDVSVKLDAKVVAEAKYVVLDRGISLAEYLSGLLRDSVHRDYVKVGKKIASGEQESK
jgi:hypothetical protein